MATKWIEESIEAGGTPLLTGNRNARSGKTHIFHLSIRYIFNDEGSEHTV